MAITQYSDNGTLYNFQDYRFPEITSSDANKIFKINSSGNIEVAVNESSKATGNLSLEKTLHSLSTETLSGNYIQWNDIIKWHQHNYVAAGLYASGNTSVGGPLTSDDGFTYYYVGGRGASVISPGFFSMCAGNKLIASTAGTSPALYYSVDGISWNATTMTGAFSTQSAGTYFDIATSGNKYLAKPHNVSSTEYAYSINGNSWTVATLPATADTQFVYHNNNFYFLHLNTDSSITCYYFNDFTSSGVPDWQSTSIATGGVITSIRLVVADNYIYMMFQSSSAKYFYAGSTFASITTKTGWLPSIDVASISRIFVSDKVVYCWLGGSTIYKLDTAAATPSWTTVSITYQSTTITPANICALDGNIYASLSQTTLNVYTSSDGGKTWAQGLYEYSFYQPSQSSEADDTTKIIVDLLKRDDGTYQINSDDVGAISAPEIVQDGQILQYNAASDSWIAVAMPAAHSYRATFTSSWGTAVSGWYTLTYSRATHGCGTSDYSYLDLNIDIYALDGTSYVKIDGYPSTVAWKVEIDSSGSVSLKATTPFAGAIVIK